jgi:hypothetical protein
MPSVPSISFNVRFDLTGAPSLLLTDTTTYPVGAIGIFTVTQPDGYVRTGNFATPDVTSSGGTFSTNLRLSSTGGVQCGTYTILYEIKTTDDVVSTFTRSFVFQYVPVDLVLTENFDVFTPNLSYSDSTNYSVSGYNNTAPTRAWTAVSIPTGTKTSTTSAINLQHSGNYYDAVYTITLASTLTYSHQTYAWLSVLETISKTVTAEACTPEPIEDLIPLIEVLRQQSIECNGDFPDFEKAQTLFSHLTDMLRVLLLGGVTQQGIYDVYEDLLVILRNGQSIPCVHTNQPIPAYDLGDYAVSQFPIDAAYCTTVGDGVNTIYSVTHNLNDDCVLVQVYEVTSGAQVLTDVTITSNNSVNVSFATAPASNAYKVVVHSGNAGMVGPGVEAGGTVGQFLRKQSTTDYDTYWDTLDAADIPDISATYLSKAVYDIDNDGIVDDAEKITIIGRNSTGSTIHKGKIVYLQGSTGNRPNIILAQANTEASSSKTFGVVVDDIAHNADGQVAAIGTLHDLDTRSGAPNPFTTDTLLDGDKIWLSATNPGYVTKTPPTQPNHTVFIGFVARTSPTNGRIIYNIQNGFELDELHNVLISSAADKDILYYDLATGLWKNTTKAGWLGGSASQFVKGDGTLDSITYLTTETDPVFTAHPAYGITGTKISNWDDAYTWVSNFPTQTGNAGKFLTTDGNTLSWANVVSGVSSFNSRTGAVTLTSADVTGALGYTPVTNARTLTINGTTYDLTADRSWTIGGVGTVTSVALTVPTGLVITSGSPITTSGTIAVGLQSGYSIPTTIKQGNWDDAYTFVSGFPSQTGNSGKYLTTDGSTLSWGTVSTANIYNSDGTLTGNRTVGLGGNKLSIGTATTSFVAGQLELGVSNAGGSFVIHNSNTLGRGSIFYGANSRYMEIGMAGTSLALPVNGGAFIHNPYANLYFTGGGSAQPSTSDVIMTLFQSTKNVVVGGTTDAGFKLDVQGTARVSGGLTITTAFGLNLSAAASYLSFNSTTLLIGDAASLIGGGTAGLGLRGAAQVFGDGGTGFHYFTSNYALFSTQSAAVNLSIGIPASAVLEARSTTRGFLQPRMTGTQRDAIVSPATGLSVYNTTTNTSDFYNGTSWVSLAAGNIYTADGTLNGNRTVTSGGFNLTFTGSNIASGAIARGLNLTHTLVAAANNDVLVGLDINPTFTNGAFTGVQNIGLRLNSNSSGTTENLQLYNANNGGGSATSIRFRNGYTGSGQGVIWSAVDFVFAAGGGGNLLLKTSTGLGVDATTKMTIGTNSITSNSVHSFSSGILGDLNVYVGSQGDPVAGTRKIMTSTVSGSFATPVASLAIGNSSSLSANLNAFGVYINNTATVSGTGARYNLFAVGTSLNSLEGNTIIGGTVDSGFKLDVQGTGRYTGQVNIIDSSATSVTGLSMFGGTFTIANSGGFRVLNFTNGAITVTGGNPFVISNNARIDIYSTATNSPVRLGSGTAHIEITNNNLVDKITLKPSLWRADTPQYLDIVSNDASASFGQRSGSIRIFTGEQASTNGYGYIVLAHNGTAQRGTVAIGAATTHASAILDVASTTQGFLAPRMTSTQRSAISTPAVGLVVYQTDATEGLYQYLSTGWAIIGGSGGVTDGDKGDITVSGSGATWTIDNTAVTYAKIQNVAANSFLANVTGSAATVQEIATNRIPLFSSAITGTPSATTFLRGDGSWATPSGSGGGITRSVNNISTNTTAGAAANTDYVYLISGTTTLTLPTAVGNTNRYTLKNVGTGTVTINTTSSQTIDGSTSITMAVRYTALDVISDGTNWNII